MFPQLYLYANLLVIVQAISITVDSYQVGNEGENAIDGNTTTFWHSEYSPTLKTLPHTAVIDLGTAQALVGNMDGNIGQYTLELSTDDATWTLITNSKFADDRTLKTFAFAITVARYIRIVALTEAGNRAAAFLLHGTGQILTFSAYKVNAYAVNENNPTGNTWSATYDPATGLVSELDITATHHDMFCPGMSVDSNGRAVVTGGDDANKTSIYDPQTNLWSIGAPMNIPRGYQASATLSDGRIFTIGGSWSGARGGKNGEIYNPTSNTWTLLRGCPVAPMLTADAQGIFRQDSHGWLFGWKNGYVFQAGPSKAMNWYGTTGVGTQVAAGLRGTDTDSMDGNAVMYDAINGKILTLGGSPSYQNSNATSNVHLITIGTPGSVPTVTTLTSMSYKRAFANGIVLPDGKVMVTGGQPYAVPFTDTDAVLTPELWDPVTMKFTILAPHTISRTYHSIGLLMLDGRVFTGGGGLCASCATNHEDAQIYSPAYLFNADGTLATRPVVTSVSASTVVIGGTFKVVMTAAASTFSIIRYGSATHTVDTDQRRIALTPTATSGTTYTFNLPTDSGIALPGYWMFFALSSGGVPSVAQTIKITLS